MNNKHALFLNPNKPKLESTFYSMKNIKRIFLRILLIVKEITLRLKSYHVVTLGKNIYFSLSKVR